MTAKDFAYKYANKQVKWTPERVAEVATSRGYKWADDLPIGTVIGYLLPGPGFPDGMVIYHPSPELIKYLNKCGITNRNFISTCDKGKIAGIPHYATYPHVILPTGTISYYPDICPVCKFPAYTGAKQIDCFNPICKHKYHTRSGLDLFIPKK